MLEGTLTIFSLTCFFSLLESTAIVPLLATTAFRCFRALFFCGEGPRSRRYERTAALRLIVQPYDEDEEKDDHFFHFSK
jgi:hypothetical protein